MGLKPPPGPPIRNFHTSGKKKRKKKRFFRRVIKFNKKLYSNNFDMLTSDLSSSDEKFGLLEFEDNVNKASKKIIKQLK